MTIVSKKNATEKNTIIIYTDGSCLGNPGIGGYGAIIQYSGEEKIMRGGGPRTTNNRMEMSGIISALAWCKKNIIDKNAEKKYSIMIHSDSNLIIQTLTQNWKRKANTDLWKELDELIIDITFSGTTIEWRWVKGHSNNDLNNRVDKIAVAESLKIKNHNR